MTISTNPTLKFGALWLTRAVYEYANITQPITSFTWRYIIKTYSKLDYSISNSPNTNGSFTFIPHIQSWIYQIQMNHLPLFTKYRWTIYLNTLYSISNSPNTNGSFTFIRQIQMDHLPSYLIFNLEFTKYKWIIYFYSSNTNESFTFALCVSFSTNTKLK